MSTGFLAGIRRNSARNEGPATVAIVDRPKGRPSPCPQLGCGAMNGHKRYRCQKCGTQFRKSVSR